MLIGRGLVAKAFIKYKKYRNIVIFASGVSNSNSILDSEYKKEEKLLRDTLNNLQKQQQIIYFSTTSVYDKSLAKCKYQQHKIKMENLIETNASNYLIFRLSNIIGKTGNKTNLINYFYEKICKNEQVIIWKNTKRNLIDIEYVYQIISYIIDNKIYKNETINIASKNKYTILDIVKVIEKLCNKRLKKILIDKKSDYNIDISKIEHIMNKLNIKEVSLYNLIKKYKG